MVFLDWTHYGSLDGATTFKRLQEVAITCAVYQKNYGRRPTQTGSQTDDGHVEGPDGDDGIS